MRGAYPTVSSRRMRAHQQEDANRPERTTGGGTSTVRRALVYLPPALLTVVALQQMVLSRTADLVPWKGGGFGMFSSVDSERSRIIRAFVIAEGREYPVASSIDELGRAVPKAAAYPTRARLERLAERMAELPWWLDPETRAASPDRGTGKPRRRIRPTAIRLQIFRIVFDSASRGAERLLLAEVTREVP